MKIKILKTLFFATFIIFSNCTKNDEPLNELPPITQTGENTFGCLINNKVFVTKDAPTDNTPGGGSGVKNGIHVLRGTSYFSITANNYEDTYIYISLKTHLKKLPIVFNQVMELQVIQEELNHIVLW